MVVMATQTPSIVDVATRAGVSIATASRVMSSSTYPVSESTRQKVLKAASELSYVPNSLARSLKAQKSKLLAVIVGDNADPYFAEVMRGVEEVANEHGYLTIVCNTDRNPAKELAYLHTLQDYRAAGIIFAGGGLSEPGYPEQVDAIVQKIVQRDAAVVTLSQHTIEAPSIQVDNFRGAYAMTARLLEQGHRRIAFVAGPDNLIAANLRRQGYMAALSDAGLAVEPEFLLQGDFTQVGGQRVALSIAQMPEQGRPTALFASNDETAFGMLSGLRLLGLHVPEDVSLCGFGDLPMAQVMVPPLTTVRIDLRALGRAGARKLLALLNHEQVPYLEILPTTIIERASSRPFLT
ncbi:MAG: LacI family DNA-binding transcriptional regulator [Ktedonobacteraceae bacterium]